MYLYSENKGADQLRGYREADLRLCFRICKKPVFSQRGSLNLLNMGKTQHVSRRNERNINFSSENSHFSSSQNCSTYVFHRYTKIFGLYPDSTP